MTDTTPKFDPIPRLQQIAETIRERGAYTFDAPATAAYYIDCAIEEIERLRNERDEARRRRCPVPARLRGLALLGLGIRMGQGRGRGQGRRGDVQADCGT
jgi:hypothetical protein